MSRTTTTTHKKRALPFSVTLLLVASMLTHTAGYALESTLAAWQVSAAIDGNTVTTGELTETYGVIIVTEDDLADDKAAEQAAPTSWFFYNDENDTIDNTLGSFVSGPEAPLVGDGSAQISVSGTQRRNLATYLFSGTKLADITTLSYTTYNPSAGNGGSATRSAFLNFNVDFDGSDTWQRRLTFVPANNDTVIQDEWQEWDAIDGGAALWGWSGFANNGNQWPDGNTSALRSWNDLLAAFPAIAIRTTDSWLGLRVGEPYTNGYTENIDSFTIGTVSGFTEHTVTYDFEPTETEVTDTEETVLVTPAAMQDWVFAPENTTDGQSGQMVAGPGTAPLGAGSAQFILTDTDEGEILVTNTYAGTKLDTITDLRYSTYRTTGSAAVAPALSFEFDNDVTDADSSWRGRMVYEPYHTQTVQTGLWQEWDTLDDAAGTGTGSWWGSPNALSTLDEACPQSNPCTWSEILTIYPNAGIRDTGSPFAGLLLFKAGSGWSAFDGNVDAFVIGIDSGAGTHTTTYDFEPELTCDSSGSYFEDFTLGSVDGQFGWSATGPYDEAVVSNTYGFPTFGCQTLRLSNAVTSGSFGDQIFTYSTANEAGETDAFNNGMSGGERQTTFEAEFDLATALPSYQPGLFMSVSPDRGDGARMSYLSFTDTAGGIDVVFYDVQSASDPAVFSPTTVATGLSRTTPHAIKFEMEFVDGDSNDIVRIYIDGVLVHTGTSWENYYRFDDESNPGLAQNNSRTVDSLLFRMSGTAAPAHSGHGFLVDNFELSTSGDSEPVFVPGPGDVVINEIMWMGSDPSDGGSTADEWIELRNMTDEDIDLSGWVVENLGTNPTADITIPSGTLEAGGYFLIGNYASDHEDSALSDSIVVDYTTVGIQLLNSGEELILKDASDTVIDATPDGEWAAGDNTGGTLKSMERNMVPGDGTEETSWHTCIDSGCTSTDFWDTVGDNYGTPNAENLSENDPTMPDYIDQDWSHTVDWRPDANDEIDDSELIVTAGLSSGAASAGETITGTTTASTSDPDTVPGPVGTSTASSTGDVGDTASSTPPADEDTATSTDTDVPPAPGSGDAPEDEPVVTDDEPTDTDEPLEEPATEESTPPEEEDEDLVEDTDETDDEEPESETVDEPEDDPEPEPEATRPEEAPSDTQ